MRAVLVSHKAAHDNQGNAFLVRAAPKVYGITAMYHDGRVRTTVGDVWRVKRVHEADYDYIVDEAVAQ